MDLLWLVLVAVLVVGLVVAYRNPSLFKKSVDAATDAAKDQVNKLKQ